MCKKPPRLQLGPTGFGELVKLLELIGIPLQRGCLPGCIGESKQDREAKKNREACHGQKEGCCKMG